MKKIICLVIAAVMSVCLLASVLQHNVCIDNFNTNNYMDEQIHGELEPYTNVVDYFSLDDFMNEFANDILCVTSSTGKINESNSKLSSFSRNRLTEKSIYIPCVGKAPVELRQKEGYPTVSFFYEEEYGEPWVWYFLETKDGSNAYIKIMYLDTMLTNEEILEANKNTVSWTINRINPQNSEITTDGVIGEYTTNKTIELNDKYVIATQTTLEDSRIKVEFVCDEALVVICAKPDLLTEDWYSNFEINAIDFNISK